MPAHPPQIESKKSGENPVLPRLETIGVIGAGVMGVGLAHALAQSGLRTLLIDVSDSILESALGQIRNNARFQRLFHKDRGAAPEEILARIYRTNGCGAADIPSSPGYPPNDYQPG